MAFQFKKRFSLLLVLLSALAMSGFLSIQYSWTRSAIKAQEAIFDRSVHEAITRVIYQTEKMEIASRIKGRLKSVGKGSALFNTVDSINQLLFREFDKKFVDSIIEDSIINITKERISIEISSDKYGQPVKRIDTSIIYYEKSQKPRDVENRNLTDYSNEIPYSEKVYDPIESTDVDSLMQEFNKFLKKTFIVSDIFEDLFNLSHYLPILERLDTNKLDTLIQVELAKKDIEIPYDFGIFNAIDGKFVYLKSKSSKEDLIKRGQSFMLFPSDFFSVPNYLVIDFPNRKAYIYRELQRTFIISFILIAIVIAVFVYILVSFVRQKKLSEMRNDFINNMTHEFKTPLSTISLVCEAMKDPAIAKDDATNNTYIDIITKENIRLVNMSEKILQTSILEHGRERLKFEQVDVHKIIETTIQNIIIQIQQKSGSISTLLMAENFMILADRVHFTNVIYNLLDNANKYTEDKPRILVKTYNNKDTVIIEIYDNGIGIHKSEHKKIFDKLYRISHGNIHNVKGFGLGLSYVKAIISMHKAKIEVESEPGNGACFRLIFKFISENGT